MEFKESKEYNEILIDLVDANFKLTELATFACHADNIATYSIEQGNFHYEFNIIADETFLSEMELDELLNLKRVKYFQYSIYLQGTTKIKEIIYNFEKIIQVKLQGVGKDN
jgi:hypothetical protein